MHNPQKHNQINKLSVFMFLRKTKYVLEHFNNIFHKYNKQRFYQLNLQQLLTLTTLTNVL